MPTRKNTEILEWSGIFLQGDGWSARSYSGCAGLPVGVGNVRLVPVLLLSDIAQTSRTMSMHGRAASARTVAVRISYSSV